MVNAPRWCLIMSLRKSRSNSVARAPSSRSISSSVSMPGISSASPVRDGRSSGTCWPRDRSHSRIIWISSAWESSMRLASWRIVSRSLREASCSVISIAWAWWAIIPCMNFTSASVNRIPARSEASSGEIDRLGSPGAPGWTIGGCAWLSVATVRTKGRQATMTAATEGSRRGGEGCGVIESGVKVTRVIHPSRVRR